MQGVNHHSKKSPLNFIYKLDNVELERVSTEKDVGVNMTNSLTWNRHIHVITAKANKLLGLLKLTCPLLNDVSARRSLFSFILLSIKIKKSNYIIVKPRQKRQTFDIRLL